MCGRQEIVRPSERPHCHQRLRWLSSVSDRGESVGTDGQSEGKYLSKALNRVARGEKLENFHYHDMGMLAYIGGRKALVDTPLVKNSGFLSWIMSTLR